MLRRVLVLSMLFVLFLLGGCSRCLEYEQVEVCLEYILEDTNNSCLSEIRYFVPLNYSGTIDVPIGSSDLCYGFVEDADNIREAVDKFPEKDPIISIFEDSNLTEVKRIDVFNGTRVSRRCVKTELRWRCVKW